MWRGRLTPSNSGATIALKCIPSCRDSNYHHENCQQQLGSKSLRFWFLFHQRFWRGPFSRFMFIPRKIEISHRLFLVQSEEARVGAHESLVEDAAWQLLKVFLLERTERAS